MVPAVSAAGSMSARTAPRVWASGMFGRTKAWRWLIGAAVAAAVEGVAVLAFSVAVPAPAQAQYTDQIHQFQRRQYQRQQDDGGFFGFFAAAGAISASLPGAIVRLPSRSITSTIRTRRRHASRKPSPTPTSRSRPSWSWAAAWPTGSPTAWKTPSPTCPMSRSCARTSPVPACCAISTRATWTGGTSRATNWRSRRPTTSS